MTYKQLKKIIATKGKTERNVAIKKYGLKVFWTAEHLKQVNVRYQVNLRIRIEYTAKILGISIDEAYYYYGKGEDYIDKIDKKTNIIQLYFPENATNIT